MKKIIASIIVTLIGFCGFAENHELNDKFVNALITVESAGRNYAVGDNGRAVGCLQIWSTVVDDVNKTSKVKYTYNDRKNRAKSIAICKAYLTKYGRAYQRKTGKKPTHEVYARIWNGGPSGYKKTNTKKYWNKVKKHL